ncbi:hypothetical protein GYMLUDRAFT_45069 [Collybiopsis luxurians FD-317 M1]|uniref:Uncharacterized protein n=1 Tax=Collybiopsis luxurians FD-317 M1 TaxID=944289 RepID=A0A0D0CK00_9AGAR|nr:hypothetical protein GYMLUDRAFT_45069 [Collybiopsis luxurians FD-317 M1]
MTFGDCLTAVHLSSTPRCALARFGPSFPESDVVFSQQTTNILTIIKVMCWMGSTSAVISLLAMFTTSSLTHLGLISFPFPPKHVRVDPVTWFEYCYGVLSQRGEQFRCNFTVKPLYRGSKNCLGFREWDRA